MAGPAISGTPPVYHMLLPGQLLGPVMTIRESADGMRSTAAPSIVASFIGDGPGASPAQHAVAAGLMMAAGLPVHGPAPRTAVTANSLLRPARRPLPRPSGSPRCRLLPGAPGWC